MFASESTKEFPAKQVEILNVLLQESLQQKDLAARIGISGAGLLYHIRALEKLNLITRKTLAEVGNVSLKEVSIHPNALQRARAITGATRDRHVLITAFGKDSALGESHVLPATGKRLLEQEGIGIHRVVAFVTPESNVEEATKLVPIDRLESHPYPDYRNEDSAVMRSLQGIIEEEQRDADVFIDVTGLTKLLTIKFLELSRDFHVPSFYLGKRSDDSDFLLWLTR